MKKDKKTPWWGCGLYVDKNGETHDPFVLEKSEVAPVRPRRRAKKRARLRLALAPSR